MRYLLLVALLSLAARPTLPRDLVPGLGSSNPLERRLAMGRLEKVPGLAALRALVEGLADEDEGVRERAVEALALRRDDRERDRLAVLARRDGRAVVRAGLARVLGSSPGGEAVLMELLRDRSAAVRCEAAVGLGRIGGAKAIEPLERLLRDARPGPRIAALESLDRLDPARSPPRARAILHDLDPDARVAAVLVLSRRWDGRADASLVGALADPAWSVRIAAARAVGRLRLPAAVPALVEALERERGRVREEVHGSLAAITGLGLPDDPSRWRDWWSREGERFAPPPRPGTPPEGEHASAVTYHSIPVTSRAVSFVLDASRSMLKQVGDGERTRRDLALAELESTLRRLGAETRFNLVFFGRVVRRWQDSPRRATPAAVSLALRDARRVQPGGWTDLYGGLREALEDREVDTVYVLTDGAPSAGPYLSRTRLLAAVEALNRYRLVRLHTIGIGMDGIGKRWRGFLEALARAHDGVHVAR